MKAIFLDRDGTLIFDPPDLRVDSTEDLVLFDDTLEAMRQLAKLDYSIFLVTNQAGIAEGRLTMQDFELINTLLLDKLAPSGIKVLRIYMCPHAPDADCICHKPKPTMLQWAAEDFGIDLASSYIIGDRESDILTGVNAGTKTILVQTGSTSVTSKEATYTAVDLLDAIQYIAAN